MNNLFWLLIKFLGFVIVVYQISSLIVLVIAAIVMKGKLSLVTANYDHWWGTYAKRGDREIYWMIPFIGLKFNFVSYYHYRGKWKVVYKVKDYTFRRVTAVRTVVRNFSYYRAKEAAEVYANVTFGEHNWEWTNEEQIVKLPRDYTWINDDVDMYVAPEKPKRYGA